jgi:RND family efflux transporter MFP subunit
MRTRFFLLALAVAVHAQTVNDLAPVVSRQVSRAADLPGEFLPFQSVSVHAKVSGYVERITVDRGSAVKAGDVIAELSAPEMATRIAEAESRVLAAEAERVQAEAQLASLTATQERLQKAAATPGAIAGIELVQIEKQVDAARALIRSREQSGRAAASAREAEKQLQSYLRITAPFDGVVTERLVHPGALSGPNSTALVVIQQLAQLRLVVAVPEEFVGSIREGAKVSFQVPAQPERTYSGTVSRVSHVLDRSTRTMPVELDVTNTDGSLAPGMYPTAKWPVRRSRPALYVPRTAVVTTTERTFVIRNQEGHAEWVDVRKGANEGDLMEVTGNLKAGDMVVRRATDEMREGTAIQPPAK